MAFKLPTLRDVSYKISSNLPSFDFEELKNVEHIAHGGYGIVYKASHKNDTVVVKKVAGESAEDEDMFVKEAKLIHSCRHENIVSFLGFSRLPCSIMLEYLYFDFSPFGNSKVISNLGDLLNYMDRIDGFENFNGQLHGKISRDIAEGLLYLHGKDTAHRDLKPKNILVSNKHYAQISDVEQLMSAFQKAPIICKLSDFGESKSRQIQTAAINSTTRRVDRGTPMYMAPEILVKSVRLKSASFDDLKKVDMWAFGMVLFCLVNPDLKYPYQLDINHDENPIEQVEDLLTNHKRPTPSTKYSEMQTANWLIIHEAYEACTNFEPSQRLSAEQIKHKLCAVQPINQNQASNIQRKESDELKKLSSQVKQTGRKEVIIDLTGHSSTFSAVSGIGHDKDKELVHSEDLASLSSSSTNVRSDDQKINQDVGSNTSQKSKMQRSQEKSGREKTSGNSKGTTADPSTELISDEASRSEDGGTDLTYSKMDFNSSDNSEDSLSDFRNENAGRRRTSSEMKSTDESSDEEGSGGIDYYKGNLILPVFTRNKDVLSPSQVMCLLYNIGQPDSSVPSALVCSHQPLRVEHNVSFIVDLEALKSKSDVKCDDAGSWRNNSNAKFPFTKDGDELIQCTNSGNASNEEILLKREYFGLQDGNDNDFRKRIDTIHWPDGQMHRYCLVQYSFKGSKEHPILQRQHKNTKSWSRVPYVRTWESTKDLLKQKSSEMNPREVVHKTIADDLGGISSCSGLGQLPRDRQQVKDLSRQQKERKRQKKTLSENTHDDDPWFRLLGESKKQASNRYTSFIRDVRVAPEPLCILTNDRQLNDLKRFCCNPIEYRPFTVDPTFDIGHFNVTPITYQHLALENRRDKNHPSLIGPVLVHEKKTEQTYSIFSGTLRTLEPGLRELMAFGTDDEQALISGFRNNFEKSINLLCVLHLQKNVERKLQELQITKPSKGEIIADIFGKRRGDVLESGLTDAKTEDAFDAMLDNLENRWSVLHRNGQAFFQWFIARKRTEFLNSVISPVRQRAGLGCPPDRFTTNRSEQTNKSIQEFVKSESKSKKVDEFTFSVCLSKLVNQQQQEVELAVIGRGEYQLREKFKHLEVSSQEWESMRDEQKKGVLQRLHKISLDEGTSSTTRVTEIARATGNPILDQFIGVGIDWIPREILSSVIQKALILANKEGAVSQHAVDTIVVESASNPRKPHVVNLYPNGKMDCDCPGFSSSPVCAHTVAACIKQRRLPDFLKWLSCKKRNTGGINFSKAVAFGMPKGRGKKGEKAPRKLGKNKKTQVATTVVSRVSDVRAQINQESDQHQVGQQHMTRESHVVPLSQQPPPLIPHPYQANPNIVHPLQPGTNFAQPSVTVHGHIPSVGASTFFPSSSSQTSSHPTNVLQQPRIPSFPSANPGQFLVYLLQFCPGQTSMCFGCGNPLKPDGVIPETPNDLVVVSKMLREWMYQGVANSKVKNVYFHCSKVCIQRKQPNFRNTCFIPQQIQPYLLHLHREHINMNLL